MRILPRVLLVGLMIAGMYLLIEHVRSFPEDVEWSKLVKYYIAIMSMAAVTALVTCVSLLPLLGEFAGSFLFTPNQKIERSPHADALAKLAAGDFEGAVEEYRKVFEEDPQDTHAASEIVRLYCDKLGQPEPASDFLVEALSMGERTPEERAFLQERMVDVCWLHQHDGVRARAILSQIMAEMPETRQSANAMHRLQEIERILSEEEYRAAQAAQLAGTESAEGQEAEPQPEQAEEGQEVPEKSAGA
ncbi:MAG: tripartite tricarboxylate transporter TctB family protein [Chthoniobacteraceae bacterium]|nr:tripartite tricarboxylate transporter TctB family protein [Chthoniobacteraceae bacterium]